jgi:hypothetical protein
MGRKEGHVMAQASGGEPSRGLERVGHFAMRTIAMIVGLIGAVLALVISVLYALVHVLSLVAGLTQDSAHLVFGLLVTLIGAVGAFLAPILPIAAAVLLAFAGIAFFFVVGWWACFASPFFLVAAVLTFSKRRVDLPGSAAD